MRKHETLPKLCGADVELGNFILGGRDPRGTGDEASRALLRQIEGYPHERARAGWCTWVDDAPENGSFPAVVAGNGPFQRGFNPQDWGRKYLASNGGCAYIDLNHLEICLPEVLSAYDHVAAWHAMLRIVRRALVAANRNEPGGGEIKVLVNNSDGKGNSYGSHLNFLVTRRAWENLFHRKVHHLLYLAAYQASSIVWSGQGKVGSERSPQPDASGVGPRRNRRSPAVDFQISQRADFFETIVGQQTTYRRPIVNSRDEPLCGKAGDAADMARLHVIFFDATLAHGASLLKVGVTQIILALIEAERIRTRFILDDPVEAVLAWSHDPTLRARARMTSGKKLTAVELQLLFLEQARKFHAAGGLDGVVPRAGEILDLWEDTLLKLERGDLAALAPRLDWVLKQAILERVLRKRPELSWSSPELKHLDHLYSSLDLAEGLYWSYDRSGLLERLVTEEEIRRFEEEPPEDTRAWTRAMLLRRAGASAVEDVNWDAVKVKLPGRRFNAPSRTVELSNPLGFTRALVEPLFETSSGLEELLDGLEGMSVEGRPHENEKRRSHAS